MTDSRLSRLSAEVLRQAADPDARLSRLSAEALRQSINPSARLSRLSLEVIYTVSLELAGSGSAANSSSADLTAVSDIAGGLLSSALATGTLDVAGADALGGTGASTAHSIGAMTVAVSLVGAATSANSTAAGLGLPIPLAGSTNAAGNATSYLSGGTVPLAGTAGSASSISGALQTVAGYVLPPRPPLLPLPAPLTRPARRRVAVTLS